MLNAAMDDSASKKPSFLWQAILIVLPLLLLTAVGIYSLRQDRVLAEADARERAQREAQGLADAISKSLFELLNKPGLGLVFGPGFVAEPYWEPLGLDKEGHLLSIGHSSKRAKPARAPSVALLPIAELSARQAKAWNAARQAEFAKSDVRTAMNACSNFLSLSPPKAFLSPARYDLGLLLEENGHLRAAEELLGQVATNSGATTETGMPLDVLAQLRRLELAALASSNDLSVLVEAVCSNAVNEPSFVTPMILQRAEQLERQAAQSRIYRAQKWQHQWNRDEATREFYQQLRSRHELDAVSNRAFWTRWRDESWLVCLRPAPRGDQTASEPPSFAQESEPDIRPTVAHSRANAPEINRDGIRPVVAPPVTNAPAVPTGSYELTAFPEHGVDDAINQLLRPLLLTDAHVGVTYRVTVTNDVEEAPLYPRRGIRMGYTQITFELAGKSLNSADARLPLLARAAAPIVGMAGADNVTVSEYLADPAGLYARQRQRTLWFAALIALSAGAALAGLAGAYRGFQRQIHLNEMKSNFVSSVSHELRAPIASMRLLAEGLDRGKIREESRQKEYYRFLVQESRRLSSLIENVLDFSRIEQGRKEYNIEPADLLCLAQQTAQLMRPNAAGRQVALELQNAGADVPLSFACDGLAIQQALINLIDNAIKHSPPGGTVTVALEAGADVALLSVEDHGPGIPADEHEKIFERFYRRGTELRRETQGIGIGLTIVKHIVEGHSGRVLVRSAVGEGSRFTIELPVASQNEGVPPETDGPERPPAESADAR